MKDIMKFSRVISDDRFKTTASEQKNKKTKKERWKMK